ncbi:hypothetical protein [Photobacterium nomapromontoriensis]|uniref:hypothetical protein n=1 Tax=Photobacterium nomapromontoriensis TaxID=2910237 RepID=UPI003D0CE562
MDKKNNHIHRRLGYLKAHDMPCEIATVSGKSFNGVVVSFDDMAIVLRPADSSDPADLMTVTMFGLESITSGRNSP